MIIFVVSIVAILIRFMTYSKLCKKHEHLRKALVCISLGAEVALLLVIAYAFLFASGYVF